MFYKNGLNVKDNGCICNQFLILPISQNSLSNNIKNSKQLIQHGGIQWIKQAKEFWLLICAHKMDYYNVFNKQIKILKLYKKSFVLILKRKDKDLHVFISYQIQIYLKYYRKQRNQLQYNLI